MDTNRTTSKTAIEPYYKDESITLVLGDCVLVMRTLSDASVDSCVTDPPYELGFMGKAWDKSGIAYSVELWREVFRVLKPGAYLLAFGGSRTYHRMACAIEDAGFEIRDQIQWIYGSGFPKSLDVSKEIDKKAGHWRGKAGKVTTENGAMSGANYERTAKGDPITAAAAAWLGWGTALKPAHEPIVMARKPLEKGLTVAQNVLKWGTGAINIDKCRVETTEAWEGRQMPDAVDGVTWGGTLNTSSSSHSLGRFPANVIHDGSDEVLAGFPVTTSGKVTSDKDAYGDGSMFLNGVSNQNNQHGDSGSAARFFYSPKASKYDREAGLDGITARRGGSETFDPKTRDGVGDERMPMHRNHHPTVKPTDLMQYLCRLVTPPGGLVLDPFLGSGSTAKAALIERFRIVGIEMNPEYVEIAEARLKTLQVKLF